MLLLRKILHFETDLLGSQTLTGSACARVRAVKASKFDTFTRACARARTHVKFTVQYFLDFSNLNDLQISSVCSGVTSGTQGEAHVRVDWPSKKDVFMDLLGSQLRLSNCNHSTS